MQEQSKASKRRYCNGAFLGRYFVGSGLDIGGAPDPLARYVGIFPLMSAVRVWDLEDGDAQHLATVENDTYDFVHSSHCLEHVHDPIEGLRNWIRVTKPGGYIIVTIPDEDLYEQGHWPSRYNSDHKHTFTMYKKESWSPVSINVMEMLIGIADLAEIESVVLNKDFYNEALQIYDVDQTAVSPAECAIEFILRKNGG